MGLSVKVVLHKADEGGYWAEVPALPGCVSQGESRKEVMENIQSAIHLHLESLGAYRPLASRRANTEIATVSISA